MKILICGLGSIGQRHARNLISLGYRDLYGLRVRDLSLPDDLKSIKIITKLEDALKLKPDVVFITNPTSVHVTYAVEFAKIGCHLFIEKPLSHSLHGIDELEKLVRQKKLTAIVGYNFRFHPQLQKIKELISKNVIGKIISTNVIMGEYLPNWHPEEDYSQGYSARSDMGGGVILTQSHDMDYLYWLFGDFSEIFAYSGKKSDLKIDVEDTAQILLKFKTGVFGFLHLDYLQDPPQRTMTIIGTSGKIFWDYYGSYFEISKDGKTKKFPGPKEFERNQMFIEEEKHFFDCLRKSKNPEVSLEEGKRIVEACLAAKESAKEKRLVKLD